MRQKNKKIQRLFRYQITQPHKKDNNIKARRQRKILQV